MNGHIRLASLLALAALALPASAKTYYVDAATGNDANTGLSQTAAFKTIQRAIDKAAAGSTILVAPGEYKAIKTNNKKLAIKAVEGPDETSITACLGEVADGEWQLVWNNESGDYEETWVPNGEMKPDYAPVAAELGAWGTQAQYATVAQAFFSDGTVVKFWDDWSADVAYPDDWDSEAHWWEPSYVFVSARPRGWTSWDPPEGVGFEFREDSSQMVKTGRTEPVFKGGKNTVLTGFRIENGERAVWGGTVVHCSIYSFALPEEIHGPVETPHEEHGIVYRSTLSDCTIRSIATPARYVLTGMVVSDSTLNRCDVSDVEASASIVIGSTLANCRLAGNRLVCGDETGDSFALVAGSVLYNCTIAGNEVGSYVDWHSETVETDETDPNAWYDEENGNYYREETIVDRTEPNFAVGWSDVYGCVIAGNRDGEGNPANVRLAVDSRTGKTVAADFMNHVESRSWTDGESGEEVAESWFSLAWRTMTSSCVEDILVEQKGNNTKKGYRNSTGNIFADPRFVDPAHGDYRLAPNSPCVNAGADYTKKTGKYDLDGGARKVGKVDMGAYELQPQTAVPADYDGDGFTDAAFYFAASGQWWIFQSRDGLRTISLSDRNGVPCPADYDGDGAAEPAYFTASAKTPEFVRVRADGKAIREEFGTKGAKPLAARLSAGGPMLFGVYTANAKKPAFSFPDGPTIPFGAKASRLVVADFDGDGADDLGVYTAAASKPAFSILQSSKFFATGSPFLGGPLALGAKGAIPCCADYDGDRRADFATYLSNAKAPYFTRLLSSRKFRETWILPMGSKGDVPVPGVYETAFGPAIPAVWTGTKWMALTSDWTDADLLGDFPRPAVVRHGTTDLGTTSSSQRGYNGTLAPNLVPGSVTIKIGNMTAFQDNGDGALVGSGVNGSGSINYKSGVIQFSFRSSPPVNQDIVVQYQYTYFE